MIGMILGTSEGRKLLSLLNEFTEDIFISTATAYGGELLKDCRFKIINTKPMNFEEMLLTFKNNGIKLLVDASHPFAEVVTDNAMKACSQLNIPYIRFERPAARGGFGDNIIRVNDYEQLHRELKKVEGTILNTTGSRNIEKFIAMKLNNRIVHRVLPSVEVMEKCFSLGIRTEDIIAIKGPISYELNCSFIKEYKGAAIVLKDSGAAGGTEEKLRAAADLGIKALLMERSRKDYKVMFDSEEKVVEYILGNLNCKEERSI